MTHTLGRQFWRFVIPTVAAMLVNGLYQLVDGIFVGQVIGADGLGAINIAWPVIGITYGVAIMVGIGAGALSSIARGEGDLPGASQWLAAGLWLLLLLGIACGVLLAWLGEPLFRLQQAQGPVLALAEDYLQVLIWASPVALGGIALPFLIRNDDAPNLATLLIGAGAVINIGLDYLFIVLWDWQLTGAALATALAQAVVLVLGVTYFRSSLCQVPLSLTRLSLSWRESKQILGLGLASWAMYLYFSFITAVHNSQFLTYGDATALGAFAIVGYLCTLYYLLAEGVANGVQPLLSYLFGAGRLKQMQRALVWALTLTLISGLVFSISFLLFPELFTHAFNRKDEALLQATTQGLRWHTWALYLDGVIFVIAAYFQSVNDGHRASWVTFANMGIQLPFLLLLPLWLGVQGVWLAVPLSNVVLIGWVLWLLIRDQKRRRIPWGRHSVLD
ncbi:putative efflux protein, MATE family [Ferrimonas sediminum]|uniref:Multidrug export protein MepA n=1 Tax=Ferrimonas sediminum TaxID=718193 RepID=A0A1G8Q8H2_9GAMM|nr:MATE family efflux transporter [Ferrimonas sediminum]SDJ01001.1 putative efflux protein, MATE family [Ferrimonas sediminum]